MHNETAEVQVCQSSPAASALRLCHLLQQARAKHGSNEAAAEQGMQQFIGATRSHRDQWDATLARSSCVGTPFWKLVLKQFDDLLVKVDLVVELNICDMAKASNYSLSIPADPDCCCNHRLWHCNGQRRVWGQVSTPLAKAIYKLASKQQGFSFAVPPSSLCAMQCLCRARRHSHDLDCQR